MPVGWRGEGRVLKFTQTRVFHIVLGCGAVDNHRTGLHRWKPDSRSHLLSSMAWHNRRSESGAYNLDILAYSSKDIAAGNDELR